MKLLIALFALTATPALAHHEIVMTAGLMPFVFGVFSILVASGVASRRAGKKRFLRRK